jgi:hypothetical protein
MDNVLHDFLRIFLHLSTTEENKETIEYSADYMERLWGPEVSEAAVELRIAIHLNDDNEELYPANPSIR